MKILLRILVVLVAVMSGVALFLGIMLFGQREQLKARVHMLEDSVVAVSKQIETEQADDLAARNLPTGGLWKKDLKNYYKIGPDGKIVKRLDPATSKQVPVTDGPGTMRETLDGFLERVAMQYQRIDDTRVELVVTRDELSETRNDLKRTAARLARANQTIDEKKDEIEDLRMEEVELHVQIDTKDEQISDLETQIAISEEKVTKLEDKKFELEGHITAQSQRINTLEEQIARITSTDRLTPETDEGFKGTVVRVNPEHNFIVISTAPDSKLARGVEVVVQRGDTFIGKVRITEVKTEENAAIANIMPQWLQKPIQKGDSVLFMRDISL